MTGPAYTSTVPVGRDGFLSVVHAEWTKFRTVRAWVIATGVAAVLLVLFGILVGNGSHSSIADAAHPEGVPGHPPVPIGPGGRAVTDEFYTVHRSLSGDGTLTARVGALRGATLSHPQGPAGSGPATPTTGPVQAWAKAGLILKVGTTPGSRYVAIMLTGAHGVRMQDNYSGDIAGPAGTGPVWLRLTRTGDTVTGYTSTDGATWITVGTVRPGLPASVEAGMFAASPGATDFERHLGGGTGTGAQTSVTATFDGLDVRGRTGAGWTGTPVAADSNEPPTVDGYQQTGDGYTLTGSGDIAPDIGGSGDTLERTLTGAFATLTVLVVLAVLFVTTEYRRGLIRTSLTASPRRVRVLAAKALVAGTVAFLAGLVGAVAAIPIGEHFLVANGNFVYPIDPPTLVRLVVGTAGLIAVGTVLALAIGTIVRRSAVAVAAVIVLITLPYILATAGVLPTGPSQWLLRLTPAAGFAVQQTVPAYPQVEHDYSPLFGFYPLAPWAGFAVLCAWAVVALAAAGYILRRRDA